MKRIFGTLAGLVVVFGVSIAAARELPTVEPEKVGLSSERLQRIGQIFQQEIDKGRLPGAVILVARKGEVAYFESFGARDPASHAPMAKDAIFRIYSMTKPLVSVGAMILVEEGSQEALIDRLAEHGYGAIRYSPVEGAGVIEL